jgi:hypothetical protein
MNEDAAILHAMLREAHAHLNHGHYWQPFDKWFEATKAQVLHDRESLRETRTAMDEVSDWVPQHWPDAMYQAMIDSMARDRTRQEAQETLAVLKAEGATA